MSDNEVKVSHQQAAQALIENLRAMRGTIPNFVVPTSENDNRKLSSAASVPTEFIELTIVAVKNSLVLVRGGADSNPDTVRDLVDFAEAYAPVADELVAMAMFIRHSTKAARSRAGSEALLTYAVTRRLAKKAATADLVPVRDAMQRTLGRKRTKPQPAPDAPAPQPPVNESPK